VRPGFDLQGKRVLVVGLARTGVTVSLFSAGYGATVTAVDEKPEAELADTAARLRAAGVKLELGAHTPASFLAQDLIVVSPGVPANLPALELARAKGIPVWSEIELAWRFLRGKLVAITGSNGKTTTTSLVAHIFKTAGVPTLVGGNIGTPLLALVERFERNSGRDQQLSAGNRSGFQARSRRAAQPDARSSGPPRIV
jgi:UDP-N-acetylmuramoylalanine--D-glutamate ligase